MKRIVAGSYWPWIAIAVIVALVLARQLVG
jgi:hypothetical protein